MAVGLSLSAAGCSTTIAASEFVAKYGTNIEVHNPEYHQLPTRTYMGLRGDYVYLVDRVPFRQGGGLLGKVTYWRCRTEELPKDFPQAYRPGDVVMDGREGTRNEYMIESFVPPSRPAAPPAEQATKPAPPSK
ncbi:MAG: hypothetical protein AMJ81_12645 [Phycisphaerae bacterium SM23_33]|nr:MAG: hypothetical protein AMJ81_12645 [Phycisphaerae bacterium SM23_33]